ncbi:electron transfer flavoprotein subunit beta/FixA family protein [Neobacillus cucumis]|jgi:electron transfer flavoprotein beta subunit|uniref:electron transfer flavoprotein subunit beta/FixA family protein n=1 Tax=Neobacillus cucumis TaxID=1740721 RepID=UPI002E1EFFF0|nr:electron transfer flavoprotein subunit beta/FixA family protein [Neobacillus cucumis]
MKLLVCIKQTFDTEEKIELKEGEIVEETSQWIVNPYDEYAIEEALRLKEEHGGEVIVLTIGKERSESALRHGLAMGADHAVLIEDVESDEFIISKVIAAYVKDKNFDFILTGNQSIDNGAGQVGVRVAEELSIPHITSVVKLQIENQRVLAERDVEGETYKVETPLPVLVTCQQGLNEPRYPSLPNIMKAKRKSLEHLDVSDLIEKSVDISKKTNVVERYKPQKRKACTKIEGEPSVASQKLVKLLFEEAKIF